MVLLYCSSFKNSKSVDAKPVPIQFTHVPQHTQTLSTPHGRFTWIVLQNSPQNSLSVVGWSAVPNENNMARSRSPVETRAHGMLFVLLVAAPIFRCSDRRWWRLEVEAVTGTILKGETAGGVRGNKNNGLQEGRGSMHINVQRAHS